MWFAEPPIQDIAMLSHQALSDHIEIQQLNYRYADCIDGRRFDELADVFTPGAHIDYSVYGGAVGQTDAIIAFLKKGLAVFKAYQHFNANLQITLHGDTATGRIMCFNPQELNLGEGKTHFYMLGLWYKDQYIRTNKGWRICERVEEKCWSFNVPDFMGFVK
jgi:hypothetical protein